MNKRKILSLALGLCMVAILAVGGTLAYFTDTDTQTNTFTAGKVGINLDEAVVKADENDNLVADGDKRTEDAQTYKLHPNMTITKDPTITVDADSDNAYVAAVVTVKDTVTQTNMNTLTDADKYPTLTFKAYAIQKTNGADGSIFTPAAAWAEVKD